MHRASPSSHPEPSRTQPGGTERDDPRPAPEADLWLRVDVFARAVHASLDLDATTYALANESRRLLECERVTVAVCRGRRCRIAAVSGVAAFHPRANAIRLLEELTSTVAAAGDSVWWDGNSERHSPQIERPLAACLDETHARAMAILPLHRSTSSTARPEPPVGVLILENFTEPFADGTRDRASALAAHAAAALGNALEFSAVPRWLRWTGRPGAALRRAASPRLLAASAVLLLVSAALLLIPAELEIEARGELQPANRRDIFAPSDGIVEQLPAVNRTRVAAGETLALLRDPRLELEFARVLGEQQTVLKKLAAVEATRVLGGASGIDRADEYGRLSAEEEELKEQLASLKRQHEILERQRAALTVTSPIDGQVLNWNLAKLLFGRPVERGALLMNVADVDGPWIVELEIPDHRVGHVVGAQQSSDQKLEVEFVVAAEPGRTYRFHLNELGIATEINDEGQPAVRGRVEIENVSPLRPGATVHARIACGTRSLGYVWFHELLEAVERRLLF